jgi:hypothetical protein
MPDPELYRLVAEEFGKFGDQATAEEWAAIAALPQVWVYRHRETGDLTFRGTPRYADNGFLVARFDHA